MPVIKLLLAYDGTNFHGWARQRDPEIRTIEGTLTDLLETLFRERLRLSVAGRTDAGVHARGQVASFPTSQSVPPERVQAFLNAPLAPEVVVRKAALAPAGFDARSSASAREYRFVIDTSPVPDPFSSRYAWHRPGDLSVGSMRSAGRHVLGEHDFASFCRGAEGRSTTRNLQTLTVRRQAGLVVFGFRADAFCHQMVRSLVGTLVKVGEGRLEPGAVAALLAARDRSAAPASVAPPGGLTLERVVYGRRRRT